MSGVWDHQPEWWKKWFLADYRSTDMDRSIVNSRPVELKRAEDGKTTIAGYGAVFYRADDPGTEFELWPGLVERIMPGAFDGVLGSDVRSMFNHDPNQILGRSKNGTLRLSVDRVGLRYEVDLPSTNAGKDIAESIERGDVDGSSFWFSLGKDGTTKRTEGDLEIWELRQISQLREVGPVTIPAYEATTAGMRNKMRHDWDLDRMTANAAQARRDADFAITLDISEPQL